LLPNQSPRHHKPYCCAQLEQCALSFYKTPARFITADLLKSPEESNQIDDLHTFNNKRGRLFVFKYRRAEWLGYRAVQSYIKFF
jgi:hypothetical protein